MTLIDDVLEAPGVVVEQGCSALTGDEVLGLPDAHVALLERANGFSFFDGYFRLLGVGVSRAGDLIEWNDFETWKFAWPHDLSGFLCFAETCWGDQYAYELTTLASGGQEIVFLDALRMAPAPICESFDEFLATEVLRNGVQPYDSVVQSARVALGPLPPLTHLAFSPPTLLTGEERLDQLVKLDARDAMVLNGDLWRQLSTAPGGAVVAGLDTEVDTAGRHRTRVLWA